MHKYILILDLILDMLHKSMLHSEVVIIEEREIYETVHSHRIH